MCQRILIVALVGIGVNTGSALLFMRAQKGNLSEGLQRGFGIAQSTIQVERDPCGACFHQADGLCRTPRRGVVGNPPTNTFTKLVLWLL